jgi:3-deoxy-D-arabino-heptulosonate 7-phosphate (DAHP) synthase
VPVVVDPSHATGRRDLLRPLSLAAIAAGAAGVMVETHPDPGSALSDASQALPLDEFAELARGRGASERSWGLNAAIRAAAPGPCSTGSPTATTS